MIHGVTAVLRRDFLVIDSVLFRDLSDLCWRAGVAEIGLIEDPVEDCSGPIWLRGGISLTSADGYQYEVRNRITICRCGASRNKPFCDGSHASLKFKAKTIVE